MQKRKKKPTGPKPVYTKKHKAPKPRTLPISNEERQEREPSFHPTFVPPSEKYQKIMNALFKKSFFIDAQYGTKVFANGIKEFHVDKKGVPVLLCDTKHRNKRGDLVSETKVFRLVMYNENELVGMNSLNINTWAMPTVKIEVPTPKEPDRVPRQNNGFKKNNSNYRKPQQPKH